MDYLSPERTKLKLGLNILVLAASLYGVSKKNYQDSKVSPFEAVMIESFAPIQKLIYFSKYKVGSFFDHYLFMVDADKQNKHLKEHVYELENKIYQLQEIERENLRLKGLLGFGQVEKSKVILAQVVGWDSASQFKVLRINKGSRHGIQTRSTVVTSAGLVGYVYRSSNNYSDVITILDQNIKVDAMVDRTRSHGIIEGFSSNTCLMKYVTRTEPVIIGDQVITSGLGNIYPKGLRVGKISKIEKESYGITQFIRITPNVDFRKLEEVVVLINGPKSKKPVNLSELDGGSPL